MYEVSAFGDRVLSLFRRHSSMSLIMLGLSSCAIKGRTYLLVANLRRRCHCIDQDLYFHCNFSALNFGKPACNVNTINDLSFVKHFN
jgi:hypothetical protein